MAHRANRGMGEEVHVVLPSDPRSIAHARSVVNDATRTLSPDTGGDAELLTSELVTNAIRYGGPTIELSVSLEAGDLTVQVYDDGSGVPEPGAGVPSPGAVSGRGLQMVDRVAHAWGIDAIEGRPGKTVWFRLDGSDQQQHDLSSDRMDEVE